MISFFVGVAVVTMAFGEVDPKSKCADSGTCSAAPVAPSLLQRAHQTESLVVEEEQTGRAATKRLRLFSDVRAGVELARASPDQARQTAREEFEAMSQGDGEVSEDDLKKAVESRPPNDECFNPEAREYNYTAMIASLDTDSSGTASTAEFEVYLQTPSFLSAVRNRAFTALSIAACTELTNQAAADTDAQSKGEALRQQAAADFIKANNYTLPQKAKPSLVASHIRKMNKAIDDELVQEMNQCPTASAVAAITNGNNVLMTDDEKENAPADLDLNASVSLVELSSTASPLSALEVAQARLNHAIRTAGKDNHGSGRRGGNPAVQGIAALVDEVWKNTLAYDSFSFVRAASPNVCDGICQDWEDDCQDWVDQSYNRCRGWSTSSTKECTAGFADETTRWCNSWIPDWLGGACDGWNSATNSVCQGWSWVTRTTCDGYDWIASGFCAVSAWVCKAFECVIDWPYVQARISPPPPLGLLEQSKESVSVNVNGARAAKGMKSIEDAVSFLTGGAWFAKELSNSGRSTAFENLKQELENKVSQARDYINNNNLVSFDSISDAVSSFATGIAMPQNLKDVSLDTFNKAAGGSSLLQMTSNNLFAIHLGVSISCSAMMAEFGLQIGVAVGRTLTETGAPVWKAGAFYEVFSPGSFETDVGVGFSFHIGFWSDFGHIAGKAVDFGMNVDLGIMAPVVSASTAGVGAVVAQAALSLHGVRTVPNDSECGKGGWFSSQVKERNCNDIRWGKYQPPPGKGSSSFAAVVLSIGWGQSVSPISGDLGASCTSGSWDGGLPHQTNCFDFSGYNVETNSWRLKATDTSSGWAWDVHAVEFWGRKTGDSSDSKMSIFTGCTAISSGHYPHYWYDADGAFGGSGFWGGRKSGGIFYIGMRCDQVWNINMVKLKQGTGHYASAIAIQSSDSSSDWSLQAQVSASRVDHTQTIWTK